MHQVLYIPEILLNIFSYCPDPDIGGIYKPDLVVLARTCKTFKEPALDVLWEELFDLSPLARCLPKVCHMIDIEPRRGVSRGHQRCYSFSRPLIELEWNTLRGYTNRVRFIHSAITHSGALCEGAIRLIFNEAPFADPLFPKLQSLDWRYVVPFPLLHAAVPSLTSLHLHLIPYAPDLPVPGELISAFGDRCPHLEKLLVHDGFPGLDDSLISHQICRWKNLRSVICGSMVLNTDAISHLSSLSNLKFLVFSVGTNTIQEISSMRSMLVFSSLVDLTIYYDSCKHIVPLLSHLQFLSIQSIYFRYSDSATGRVIRQCLVAVQEACPSNSLTCLEFSDSEIGDVGTPFDADFPPWITLEDLRPCLAFSGLRKLLLNVNLPVRLTDRDLLELVSPRLEEFVVNNFWGWMIGREPGSGITLGGLVQLLRHRPSLNTLCVAIDTMTFTEITEGLDIWYPPRKLNLNFLDSYIEPEFVPGLVTVLTALGVGPSMFTPWDAYEVIGGPDVSDWEDVYLALESF